uniref:Uncharacterized protein n=1 Tax=Arundo donax TaxID=35708 RepID=A0A0A9E3S8_ARUDO
MSSFEFSNNPSLHKGLHHIGDDMDGLENVVHIHIPLIGISMFRNTTTLDNHFVIQTSTGGGHSALGPIRQRNPVPIHVPDTFLLPNPAGSVREVRYRHDPGLGLEVRQQRGDGLHPAAQVVQLPPGVALGAPHPDLHLHQPLAQRVHLGLLLPQLLPPLALPDGGGTLLHGTPSDRRRGARGRRRTEWAPRRRCVFAFFAVRASAWRR